MEFEVTLAELDTALGTPRGYTELVLRHFAPMAGNTTFSETLNVRLVRANPTLINAAPGKNMTLEVLTPVTSTVVDKATFVDYFKASATQLLDLRPFA